jgi:hypothetical protein
MAVASRTTSVAWACLVLSSGLLHAPAAVASFVFRGPVSHATAAGPAYLEAADLDGDADLDLVAVSSTERWITVLLNDGHGAFSMAPGCPFPVAFYAASAAVGSLNDSMDDVPDLAVAGYYAGESHLVTFVGDGAGGFSPTWSTTVPGHGSVGRNAALGDWNRDGTLDIALVTGDILIGNGDATFTPALIPRLATPNPTTILAARLDGDAYPDIAIADSGTDEIVIWRGDGAGGFVAAGAARVSASPDASLESFAAADLDGDGDLDLIAPDVWANSLRILANDGAGAFSIASTSPVSLRLGYPRGIASADFDGDGLPDIVTGSNNTSALSVLRSTGGLALAEIPTSPLSIAGTTPISTVAADFDGDGSPDLAAVQYQRSSVGVFLVVRDAISLLRNASLDSLTLGSLASIFSAGRDPALDPSRDLYASDLSPGAEARIPRDALAVGPGRAGVLTFYEVEGAAGPLRVRKQGADILASGW